MMTIPITIMCGGGCGGKETVEVRVKLTPIGDQKALVLDDSVCPDGWSLIEQFSGFGDSSYEPTCPECGERWL